ncbi:hypothetical protein D3C85_1006890 [compost metagenome]
MAILYKYMPFITDYLKNPTIKLSPPVLLNDPFESRNAQAISDFMYEKFRDEYTLFSIRGEIKRAKRTKILITRAPMKTIRRSAVFSLSESNRSLLMWAHYADQHRGFVIGIEDDFLSLDAKKPIPSNLIYTPTPVKVNYDTVRFDVSEFNPLEENFNHITRLLAMKMLTTKSDDWLYEKEHRVILPLAFADEIRFTGLIADLGYRLRKHRDANDFEIKYRQKNKPVYINSDVKMNSDVYDALSSNKHFLFLKKLPPKKIHSIIFGVRAKDDDIANITEQISENKKELGHIKVYQYILCDKQFSIIKEPVEHDFHEKWII